MKNLRRIAEILLITIAATLTVTIINGFIYITYGQYRSQDKIERGGNLFGYEKVTIRSLNFLNYTIGQLVCPEAAEQCRLMEHSKKDTVLLKRDFTKSVVVRKACKNSASSLTVNYGSYDLYKTNGSFAFSNIKRGGKECQYSLVYNDAEIIKSDISGEIQLKTTAGIHECYHEPLFVFPFSLIDAQIYDKMILQGAFRKVTVIYELP